VAHPGLIYISVMRIYSRGAYKYIVDKNHPYCDKRGRVGYHKYVLEQKLGRYLLPEEWVHHIDENKDNNNPRNLELTNRSEHARKHRSTGRTVIELTCSQCNKTFFKEKRKIYKSKKYHFCSNSCKNSFFSTYMPEGNHREKEIVHGTRHGYRKGCRCNLCREFNRIRKAEWRKIKQI